MNKILSIVRKDVGRFFSRLIPVTTLLIFYLVLGLLLWILPRYGILDGYYANMTLFFTYAPILLVFLIPALNMDALSEEMAMGTIDLLMVRPLTTLQIVMAKFISGLAIVFIGLLPTITYVVTLYYLANPTGNIDFGLVAGSYLGLFFLIVSFTALSLYASSLVVVPMTALILGVFLCAFWYWAFYLLSSLPVFYGVWDFWVQYVGLDFHYEEMGSGLIRLASIVYILSLSALFLYGTWKQVQNIRYT